MSRRTIRPKVRCAVYTRKSSEEGLEQEFNSLDAQRAAGEAYVASQSPEGWLLVLAVLAVAGMMGAKVMVDEIARETPLGGAAGEWVVLYVCLSLQLSYIIAALVQRPGSREGKGV